MNDIDKNIDKSQLNANEVKFIEGYKKLLTEYEKKTGKAHFIKLDVNIKNHPWVNTLLYVLFFLPIPLFLVKMFSGLIAQKASDELKTEIPKEFIKEMINSTKGTIIDVESNDANVSVRVV